MKHISSNYSSFDIRGVSETIGAVLLLSMILMGTGALAVAGGDMITTLQDQSELDQIENSFAKLSSSTNSVALGDNKTRSQVDLGLGIDENKNKVLTVNDTGDIEIYLRNTSTGTKTLLADETLGELRYSTQSNGNDVQFGLQDSGVWRKFGSNSSMSTPPEAHYRSATLTLPLVTIKGNETINSDKITIEKTKTRFPTDHVQISPEEKVKIKITSPYYKAWGDYFENRLPGNLSTAVYAHNNTTIVELGRQQLYPDTFTDALFSTGSTSMKGSPYVDGDLSTVGTCDDCESHVSGNIVENTEFKAKDADSFINTKINSLRNNGTHITVNDGDVIEDGKYYTEDVYLSGTTTIDVSDGDVILAIDGETNIDGTLEVTGTTSPTAGNLSMFTNEDFSIVKGTGQGVIVDGSDTTHNQLYGTSSMNFFLNQNSKFEGLVYAPSTSTTGIGSGVSSLNTDIYTAPPAHNPSNDDTPPPGHTTNNNTDDSTDTGPSGASCLSGVQVCIGQNTDFNGAIVGGSAEINSGSEVTYDENFDNFEPKFNESGEFLPEIVYLHISVNEVTVNRTR